MLFDFHRQQNAKKPGTIHATYLIIGTCHDEEISNVSNGADLDITEDSFMQSSPFSCSPSSALDEDIKIPVKVITLVREADLEKIKSRYDHIDSIHIYSLGPHSVKDLQVLSEATQRLNQLCSGEDPLKSCSTYGTIQNKYLKLRVQRRPGLGIPSSSVKIVSSTVKTVSNNKNSAVESNIEPITDQLSTKTTCIGLGKAKSGNTSILNPPEKSSVKHSISKTVTSSKIQKLDKSSIFTAFTRTESLQKNEKKKNHTFEKRVTSAPEDFPMRDVFSDNKNDEDNDDDCENEIWAPLPSEKKNTNVNRKSRKEREDELRKMMEDDDEEEITEQEEKEKEFVTSLVSSETDTNTSNGDLAAKYEQPIINAGKKRRSRRRVMKKTTFKDEEGYLVTKEEPAWESFSEDEPNVSKPIVKIQQSTTSKPKKATVGKSAQGNIMSFFGKKI